MRSSTPAQNRKRWESMLHLSRAGPGRALRLLLVHEVVMSLGCRAALSLLDASVLQLRRVAHCVAFSRQTHVRSCFAACAFSAFSLGATMRRAVFSQSRIESLSQLG